MKLYVGNLSFDTTEEKLQSVFADHGSVSSATIITDRITGRPRGFGFVEMADNDAAKNAIEKLNNVDVDGRKIIVNEARPMKPKGNGFRNNRERNFNSW